MSDAHSASNLVVRHSLLYGRAIIEAQMPNYIDGFKRVYRRVLITVRDKGNIKVSSQKLLGESSELHPHGDSIYYSAARLGQIFEYNPPLLVFDSSCGTYAVPKPAAPRYTSFYVADFTKDVFFNGIDYKALPKQLDELLVNYEPIYLVPAIPTALVYANNSVGYAFSSYTIPHHLADVCDLVVAFAQHKKADALRAFDYAKHAEKFLPDFPTIGTLTHTEELLAAYRQGDFSHRIQVDGEASITADTICIKSLPYGVPFDTLEARIQELIHEKGSWFDRNISGVMDLSNAHDIGAVEVRLKRGVNVFEAWEQLRRKIRFSDAVTPILNYNDDGYVVNYIPPTILSLWYEARVNILISSKKMIMARLTDQIRRVEAQLIIVDSIAVVIAIIQGSNTTADSVRVLQERFNLTEYQAECLTDTPIGMLSKTSLVELTDRRARLGEDLAQLQASFAQIPDEIAKTALAIKKKYPTARRTKIPAYIGYVRVGDGCIQIGDTKEILEIIDNFPKAEIEIYIYDGPHLYKVSDGGKLQTGSAIPKITTGDIYGLRTNQVMTVNITNGSACCVRGFVPGTRAEGYFYTTPISRVITRRGEIRLITITDEITLRKTISSGAMTNILYVYPDPKSEHYVFALNSTTPNVIAIQRVSAERSKIAINPEGDVHLVHSTRKHTFLNIPARFLNRNVTRVVEFIDIPKLLDTRDQLRLDLNAASTKTNTHIRLY